ncbi:DHH phosphoesterase [Paraphaeosphaeria sporulosa]|uniref:DHH phosphoesterase n=1 Tax=Paraphaeosphaeria sporulosa TaxID=1460663 RepID=A0A177BVH4_9PLEO|nr:DHH phosphoesterase [Paraphaeosphaeria sporulosa]OAF98970.1 DHH phosphoesterase [Paraphaeosphaeria sporulosa]
MRTLRLLLSALLASVTGASRAPFQQVLDATSGKDTPMRGGDDIGVGHFSEWSRATKKQFFVDWQAGRQSEWVFVMGNEAGDLDSMASALTWAYHLEHSTQNTSNPTKAIALLQTQTDALDLRPENKLALKNSKMTSGHDDLLTMDELPEDPETLALKLRGIVLVDHASPLRKWETAKIISIFDHHVDKGTAPDASPRIFEKVASCTSLVARQMFDEFYKLPEEYHLPHELLELILSAISIDSGGLKDATETDLHAAKRVFERSQWADRDLHEQMEAVDEWLSDAKKDLDDLSVRDLLRRDWKGDLVDTPSPRTPTVSLGFASIPYSLDEQIEKTGFGELFHWFAVHAAWTASINTDIDICLNKYKVKTKDGKKKKIREIVLTVRDDVRIDKVQADNLFKAVTEALEGEKSLGLERWHRAGELGGRQMVWTHESGAGRKVIRPIVEEAVRKWDM